MPKTFPRLALFAEHELFFIRDQHVANYGQFVDNSDYLMVANEIVDRTSEKIGRMIAEFIEADRAFQDAIRPASSWGTPRRLPADDPRARRRFDAHNMLIEIVKRTRPVRWSNEDQDRAVAEGWRLCNYPETPEIQRCDSAGIFDTDEQAIDYVRRLAHAERDHAVRALQLHEAPR